jgi:hypothetical protein
MPLGLVSFGNLVAAAADHQAPQALHYLLFLTTHLLATKHHSACPLAA